MRQFVPDNTFVRSPREAAKVFATGRYYPKQRNTFVVRFLVNGSQADQQTIDNLTFVAKMVERPKVNPKTEELHEYNKKRIVHTGFKLEPVRMQFYDDARGQALAMWKDYAAHYFGDLNSNGTDILQPAVGPYQYDATGQEFFDNDTGFGFIGAGDSRTQQGVANPNEQFYFSAIQIFHLYDNLVDAYHLINPRITIFDPDDLDFENSAISLVSMTIVYENLQYMLQASAADLRASEVFATGASFDGDVLPSRSNLGAQREFIQPEQLDSSADPVESLFAPAFGPLQPPADYRYFGGYSTGGLGMFGNFLFGPHPFKNFGQRLGQTLLNDVALTAALNLGVVGSPLAISGYSMTGASNMARRGMSGAAYDVQYGRASAYSSGYGDTVNMMTAGMMASAAIQGDRPIATPYGVVLSPQGYGAINARQSGTAQYGYNSYTSPDGSSWGYTGQSGYAGPYGNYNDGPYSENQPSGLDGRWGVATQPFVDYNTSSGRE